MSMNAKWKGAVCGIIAAVSYGTNPLGALFLYREGLNAHSVLFYRFSLAAAFLALLMVAQKKSFLPKRRELPVLGLLGLLFAVSSLSLFSSFHYMDAGVASTLLFIYPVMVAIIMAIFYKEKVSAMTWFSILMALGGIALLYRGEDGAVLSGTGVWLVMLSSLSYAVYIVVVNRSPLRMSSVKLTFYVLLFCVLAIGMHSLGSASTEIQWLSTPTMWMYALMLALIPTVISLVFMVIAVHAIGSTPTAIMGALEPLTAVCIGIGVFGEACTPRLLFGMCLILAAVILIIAGKSFSRRKLTWVIGKMGHTILKHWRWK